MRWLLGLLNALRRYVSGDEEPRSPAQDPPKAPSDRDLLNADERALFEQLDGEVEHEVIAYPPKADEAEARDWVTQELQRRTGGVTRHPLDLTSYPQAPTEADRAAKELLWQGVSGPVAAGFFTSGMSMRHLQSLLDRAKAKDASLTDEQLMALRSRGLI